METDRRYVPDEELENIRDDVFGLIPSAIAFTYQVVAYRYDNSTNTLYCVVSSSGNHSDSTESDLNFIIGGSSIKNVRVDYSSQEAIQPYLDRYKERLSDASASFVERACRAVDLIDDARNRKELKQISQQKKNSKKTKRRIRREDNLEI